MITTPGQQDKGEPEQEMDMQTVKETRGKQKMKDKDNSQ